MQLASSGGIEFAPGEFAAKSEASRDRGPADGFGCAVPLEPFCFFSLYARDGRSDCNCDCYCRSPCCCCL